MGLERPAESDLRHPVEETPGWALPYPGEDADPVETAEEIIGAADVFRVHGVIESPDGERVQVCATGNVDEETPTDLLLPLVESLHTDAKSGIKKAMADDLGGL